ncbi:unnamed protein product [Paramecium sonneborni]|uniref:Transmembrane protein n=1 Tax=Paramecium sonneborni TaxID=65129 RepID=A0A8S1MVV5_9CILI|nr:unnamed protein product [Paramecium sonneborni]
MLRMTSYNIEVQEIKLVEYFAYLLYPPLYYSGPLIQFTNWQTQIRINQQVNKKHKYIIIGFFLLTLQILTQCYALTNHSQNEWLWDKQISTLSGVSFFITSTIQIYFKFIFLWALQECWASYDNIDIQTNNPKHIFMINSAQSFEKYFCATYNQFLIKYIKDIFSQNTYLNLLLIYSITIILVNCDLKTIWLFVTLWLFHVFEEKKLQLCTLQISIQY